MLWDAGRDRGPYLRVTGLEYTLEATQLPGAGPILGKAKLQAGVHRPLDGVMKGRTVATLGLLIRP